MLTKKFIQYCTLMRNQRFISQTMKNFESKPPGSASPPPAAPTNASHMMPGQPMHINSDFDKWLLVWVKRFPKGQVPDKVSGDVIHQAQSRARVKTANYMIVMTVIMSICTVMYTKKQVRGGDSIQKRQDDWRESVRQAGKKEAEAAAAAAATK